MSNEVLYKELETQFGEKKMIEFSQILSNMHHILYLNENKKEFNEHSFERDWWFKKYEELTKKNK